MTCPRYLPDYPQQCCKYVQLLYNIRMIFEWDDEKRVEIEAPHPIEKRWIEIGAIGDKLWTAIFTVRNDAVRIISVRRSRVKEKKIYEEETLSRNNR